MVLPEIKRKALCTAIVQRAKRSAVPPLFCLSQSARILSHVPVSFPVRSCPLTLTRRENLLCTTTCFLLSFNPPVQKLPSMTTSLDGLSAGEPSSLSGFFMYSSFSLPFSVQVVLIISVFHGFVKTKKIKIFLGRTETAPWGGRGAERNSESVLTPAFGQEWLLCSLCGRTYVSDSHLDAAARPPDREAVPVRPQSQALDF